MEYITGTSSYFDKILQQQDDSSEQLEINAMMIQSATHESSNTTEEGSSSSKVESQPIHGRGSLVQQVARRVEAYMRYAGVSDAMMPRIMDTIPPSLWFQAIRATVAHITSSDPDNHMDTIPPIQPSLWTPYHPAYGSKPYEQLWHTFNRATQIIMYLISCRKIFHQRQPI